MNTDSIKMFIISPPNQCRAGGGEGGGSELRKTTANLFQHATKNLGKI